jgi:hypothetical protein
LTLSFLGQVLAQLLGEAAAGALSREGRHRAAFPEGEARASLGAVAAFLGTLSLIFGLGALSGASGRVNFNYMGAVPVCSMAAFSLAGAYGAYQAGKRAQLVTWRHRGLAKYGCLISWPAMLASASALILGLIRVVEWRL